MKGKEEEAAKYRDYFDFSEPLKRCSSHRLLAIRRGESEGLLKVSISPDDEECAGRLEQMYVRGNNECSRQVGEAVRDAYKRRGGNPRLRRKPETASAGSSFGTETGHGN